MSERLRKDEWTVRPVSLHVARMLVEQHHYSGGCSNTATYCHGLFRQGAFWEWECKGVAWWIPPTKSAALATYPPDWQAVLSLSRLVVCPDVPKNGASFILGYSMRLIDRERWPCLVTYADEWQGHTGAIYRATNWQYEGLTARNPRYVLDGRLVSKKAGPSTRTHAEMLDLGCEFAGYHSTHKYTHIIPRTKTEQLEMKGVA